MSKGLLVLLPPSEGKSESAKGPKLDLTKLSFANLKSSRQTVIKELIELSAKQPIKAQKVLKLSKKQLNELEKNANLLKNPTAPAVEIYSGVLYESLDFANLKKVEKDWVSKKVYIASAIFGIVKASDKIVAYRLSGETVLPKIGSVKKYWQIQLENKIENQFKDYLIFDLRSGVYASTWTPGEETIDKYVVGKVVQKVKQNRKYVLKTVSHHNKATKGKLVAALAKAKANPRTAQELEKILKKLGFEVQLVNKKNKSPITLTIVMP